jgi:hypothetical protein
MKKLKHSKQMLLDAQAFLKNIETNYSKLNKEYAKNILKLLEKISIGEKLDLEMLKAKYLNEEEPVIITTNITIFSNISEDISSLIITEDASSEVVSSDISSEEVVTNEEIILDKITINSINYYYENKENGRIFDVNSKVVGEYKNKIHNIL